MLTSDGTDNFKPPGFIPVREAFGWFGPMGNRLSEYLRQRNFLYTGEDELENTQHSPQKMSDERFKYFVTQVTKAASEREIRNALYEGKIRGSILTLDGKLVEMPSEIWGSAAFRSIVETGHATLNVGSNRVRGRVFIRHDDLEAVCAKWPTGRSAKRETTSAYVPPYIAFMLRATQELGLSESHRAPKEVIEDWLREHWPSDFGMPTGNKISYMATFLRHPGDEKGGHFKPERTKT